MKLGIPNFIPVIGFMLFGTIGTFMTTLFLKEIQSKDIGPTIFMSLFIFVVLFMLGLLCYRWKIIYMNTTSIFIIFPFRFKLCKFNFEQINGLNWDLWETYKMGDYKKLVIKVETGFQANISDLEFWNFDQLEKWVLDHTNAERNLDRKQYIEIEQAKYNRWINLITIPLLIFALVLLSGNEPSNLYWTFSQIAILIIIWRLTTRLIQYQARIKNKHNTTS